MAEPESHADVIALWPSVAEFARAIGARPNAARMWKHRNRIPPRYYRAIIFAAHRDCLHDITYARLVELASRAKPPSS
jgi:hypothetical protein